MPRGKVRIQDLTVAEQQQWAAARAAARQATAVPPAPAAPPTAAPVGTPPRQTYLQACLERVVPADLIRLLALAPAASGAYIQVGGGPDPAILIPPPTDDDPGPPGLTDRALPQDSDPQ